MGASKNFWSSNQKHLLALSRGRSLSIVESDGVINVHPLPPLGVPFLQSSILNDHGLVVFPSCCKFHCYYALRECLMALGLVAHNYSPLCPRLGSAGGWSYCDHGPLEAFGGRRLALQSKPLPQPPSEF